MSGLQRRFFRLALINILSTVTVPLVGLVDTAMLGHLPDIRFLAGVALASLLFDYLYWTLGFLRMSTTGITAQAVGRKENDEVGLVLYRSMLVALVLGTAIAALQGPLGDAGFAMLSGEPGVEQAGREYFDARIWGAPAVLSGFVLMGWFLGREQSRHVLKMAVVGNLANVLLNYVFIIRMQMEAYGAGLARKLDMIVANQVGEDRGFDSDENTVDVYWAGGERSFETAEKTGLAREIVKLVAERFEAVNTRVGVCDASN